MTQLQTLFERIFEPSATVATAPMLVLGIGLLLFLVADVIDALRGLRPVIFVTSILVSLGFELRILFAEVPPGSVLDGTFQADATTALFGCLFLLGTLLAWAYGVGYYRVDAGFKAEHDALMLAAPVGMMLMVGATDLLVFFVGLELLSLPLYTLAAFRRARADSVEAGVKYFLLGAFASGLFLYGAALVYHAAGSVDLAAIAATDLASGTAPVGLALIASSLMFKVSVFPFHLWVPDVYQGSPTPVTALMATGTKAAAFGFLVLRVAPLLPEGASWLIALSAIVTMALGNLGALVQENLKRMLAYSGIAHAGTLLLVVAGYLGGAGMEGASEAVAYYMTAYVFTATGAFGLIGLLEADGERFTSIRSWSGLGRTRPGIAAAMTLFLLSLGGIPFTGGFLGKWFAFSVLVEANMIGTAVVGALLSVVALGYYLRVIIVMWMQPAPEGELPPMTTRPLTAGLATVICAALVVATGVLPSLFLSPLRG